MKPTDFLSGVIHLFNDLIGSVVPGILLVFGLYLFKSIPELPLNHFLALDISIKWSLIIVVSYVIGHALLSLHRLLQAYIGKPVRGINSLLKKGEWDTREHNKKIASTSEYIGFMKLVSNKIAIQAKEDFRYELEFNNLRSMAMTISTEGGELARRFMFISLFCYGVSMAVLVLSVVFLTSSFSFEWLAYLFTLFFIFYVRGIDFEYRALNVPFPIALSEILCLVNGDEGTKDEKEK